MINIVEHWIKFDKKVFYSVSDSIIIIRLLYIRLTPHFLLSSPSQLNHNSQKKNQNKKHIISGDHDDDDGTYFFIHAAL